LLRSAADDVRQCGLDSTDAPVRHYGGAPCRSLARFNDNLDLLAMPRGAVVDAFASLLVLSLAAVRAPPGAVDDRSDGITHHDAEAASEVDVDCAAHGQAPHGILRRNLFRIGTTSPSMIGRLQ